MACRMYLCDRGIERDKRPGGPTGRGPLLPAQRTAEASLAEQPEQSAESKAEILLSELAEVGPA